MTGQTILIAGGYGVVGGQIAQILRQHYPDTTILLGGRRPEQGQVLAAELGNAKAIQIDLALNDPLSSVEDKIDIVLCAVNDIDDHLMLSAISRRVAYIDITRWTEWMRTSKTRAEQLDTSQSPVVFASSWMAATVSTIVRSLVAEFTHVESIDLNILYAGADKSGPNSIEYMDRLAIPFEVIKSGRKTMTRAFQNSQKVDFAEAGAYRVYNFDTPDQFTLPSLTHAQTVVSRIGFDDNYSGPVLSFLVRSGIWKLISGPRFTKLRHGLMHNPGNGAPHRIEIKIAGKLETGKSVSKSWLMIDPQGQTHLTAVGAVIQLDRLVRSQRTGQQLHGVHIAEAITEPAIAKRMLDAEGVTLTAYATEEI